MDSREGIQDEGFSALKDSRKEGFCGQQQNLSCAHCIPNVMSCPLEVSRNPPEIQLARHHKHAFSPGQAACHVGRDCPLQEERVLVELDCVSLLRTTAKRPSLGPSSCFKVR